MTAIEAHDPTDGDDPFELDGVFEAAAAVGADSSRFVVNDRASEYVDPAALIGRRLLSLESGNAAERELARFMLRCLDIAERTRGRVADDDGEDADADGRSDAADLSLIHI